ncbi:hypothetical protein [Citrobacter braakii]|uniref:PP2C family protein-serine/threonine phosphatase n=1 Tax=Citrobacter braakii TaxID=57706 RepID=UPI0030808F53
MFTERLASWLARSSVKRGINQPEGLNAVLSSDIGLVRNENQDLIAAIRVNTPSNVGKPFFAMALLDGMGGMQEGKQCAIIALSTFFYSLIKYRTELLESRLNKATLEANLAVYKYANGNGGATLSAIIIDSESQPVIVNVGDSRIYSFSIDKGLNAISKDDSLEALGGRGKGLLQFIGMGDSLKPHVSALNGGEENILLTSDGTHFISQNAFEEILNNSANFMMSAQRISEYVRWCGARDNASLGLINYNDIIKNLNSHHEIGVELWDPHGNLHIMWMKNYPAEQNYFAQNIVDENERQPQISPPQSLAENKNITNIENNDSDLPTEKSQGDLFLSQDDNNTPPQPKKNIKNRKPRLKKKSINKNDDDSSVKIDITDEGNKNDN